MKTVIFSLLWPIPPEVPALLQVRAGQEKSLEDENV